jgi:hypothetical protein
MQCGVSLDDVFDEARYLARTSKERTTDGADNTGRYRAAEAQWIADSDHQLADMQTARVTKDGGCEAPARCGPNDGEIGEWVGADDLDVELAAVGERGDAPIAAINHVRRRQKEPIGCDQNAAAAPLLSAGAATRPFPDLEVGDRGSQLLGDAGDYLRIGVEGFRLGLGHLRFTGGTRTLGAVDPVQETKIGHDP